MPSLKSYANQLRPESGSGQRSRSAAIAAMDVAGVSGAYFIKCRQREPTRAARDDAAAERLWAITENAVAFSYPQNTARPLNQG